MSGRAVDLPLVRHRYGDYVRWLERRWPAVERDAALGRWRQRLDGAPALLDLPLDKRRPPRQSFAGDSITLEIDPASAAGLEKLARGEKATPFVAWLSLVAAVLGRQAGADDLVLGVPVANRSRPETSGVIGFFLNTLPLRLRPRGTLSFLGLVRETREQVVAALADAELPFEFVVDAVRPARDLSHSPIFQVLMTHDEDTRRREDAMAGQAHGRAASGLKVQPIVGPGTTSQFDLSIHVRNTHVTLEYCTALFSRETIAELGRTMVAAAECVRDHPDTPLAELSFLAPGESGRLLAAWNAPSRRWRRGRSARHARSTLGRRARRRRVARGPGSHRDRDAKDDDRRARAAGPPRQLPGAADACRRDRGGAPRSRAARGIARGHRARSRGRLPAGVPGGLAARACGPAARSQASPREARRHPRRFGRGDGHHRGGPARGAAARPPSAFAQERLRRAGRPDARRFPNRWRTCSTPPAAPGARRACRSRTARSPASSGRSRRGCRCRRATSSSR